MLFNTAIAAAAHPGKDREPGKQRGNGMSLPFPMLGTRETGGAPKLSPDMAAREIQRRHGGRVLAVQPDGAGYRVKMLKNGEVRIYQVDP
ncbi:hypothetical protein [Solimonas marina]|uniref:PepSY domain-containing protein n=1 Tax=Solimonas marina TaxID=2714601 RepID=A0A970BAJ0_9GAMM|nr:hypothetical protein [Solimonas marina]NKF23421.1 hypothetical protein [Solimonas marina]